MASVRRFFSRLVTFLRGDRAEQELQRELGSHLALLQDDFERQGVAPDDAARAARRASGGIEQAKERHRDARSFTWMEDLYRDVGYALRGLARTPGFTFVAVLTLALGIGATTAIFSVVNSILLKPLPYPHSDRIVRLLINLPADRSPTGAPFRATVALSPQEIDVLRAQSHTLSHVATAGPELVGLDGHDDAARFSGARVSSAAFDMLGIRPLLGRTFDRNDDAAGAEPVVLISATAWQRYFGGDPAIVGRPLTLNSVLGPRRQTRYIVAGVLPDIPFPRAQTQFWMPQRTASGAAPAVRGPLVARLRDGVSLETAASETVSLVREIRRGQRANDTATYQLVREQDELVAPIKPALGVLMMAVSFVLLIVCANVANLLIARSTSRHKEIGIRAAIGAARGRLVRQALTESMTLGAIGGAAGIALAYGALELLRRLVPTVSRFDLSRDVDVPRLEEIGVDATVLLFTVAISMLAGIVFGLLPAVRLTRLTLVETLKTGSGGRAVGMRRLLATRGLLVIAEVSLAMVVLVGGALLMQSFVKLSSVNPGYRGDHVLTFQVSLPLSRYPDARLKTFAEELVARLRAMPGANSAAYANQLPMVQLRDTAGGVWKTSDPRRAPAPAGPDARFVSQDYLSVMGIRVRAGRGFTASDDAGAPRVLLINETLARQQFPGQRAIGEVLFVGRDPAPWTVAGIVPDVRQFGLDKQPEPQFFADVRQVPSGMPIFPFGAYYAVRTTGDPAALIPAVRRAVRDMDREAAAFNVVPMDEIVTSTLARPRVYAVFLSIFAGIGVFVAGLGVYGMLAFTVAQRTREIGIRMALGARRATVMRAVLRQSLGFTAAGVSIGTLAAVGTTRYLTNLLFGLTPLDPLTFSAAALFFVVVAVVASIVPARRAMKVDPIVALRCE